MKKTIVMVLCLVLVLALVGCGSNKDQKDGDKKDGDTTVKIEGIVYYNTKKTISVEPDESVIVNEELPLNGSMSDEKITAYAFINEEKLGDILVCLVDGEWYQFVETDRGGQP
ncbi:MAG: hypothetical protein ILP09_09170 [Oscillospiraceae bacterium]|nr:hypothetical protein [Oscillospiraceae bacterium]